MTLDPALRTRIDTLLHDNRIVLFMKGEPRAPQCGFSAKAVGALDSLGVQYAHVDVLSDPAIRDGIKVYGDWPTIPQLYIGGDLVGGSDIIEQMANSGELHAALGLPAPDRTPPAVTISPAAIAMLREALDKAEGNGAEKNVAEKNGAGDGHAVQVVVDPAFNTRLQLAPADANAIAVEVDGIRVQFDLASARRADGLAIDWVDDERGRGLVIDNPNAPTPVRPLSPMDAAARVAAGTLVLVDVRPAQERAFAAIKARFDTFDNGSDALEALPKDTALAFLCHHGNRSAQAAEHFRQLGFGEVYNVTGGIDAWADMDPAVPKY